jgi:hypothetical protein
MPTTTGRSGVFVASSESRMRRRRSCVGGVERVG